MYRTVQKGNKRRGTLFSRKLLIQINVRGVPLNITLRTLHLDLRAREFQNCSILTTFTENFQDVSRFPGNGCAVVVKKKQPWAIGLQTGKPFALGGIWDPLGERQPSNPALLSYSIVTNELLAPLRDRAAALCEIREAYNLVFEKIFGPACSCANLELSTPRGDHKAGGHS
jgi:hypothetical protein